MIDTHGYLDHFYQKEVTYWDYEGYTYWHMENIINRCVVADTYHRRVFGLRPL
ncbi:MAG: hypothetical protein PF904_04850 [Kiritimatiellae bacterium]|jgi:hypothetical protein|nr:hypothetical protein [Kiritimatiellia bacterium]